MRALATKPVSTSEVTPSSAGLLQRKCAACTSDDEREGLVQRSASNSQAAPRSAPVLSGGEPLAPALRSRMQTSFGYDFQRVRIHTDERASLAARSLAAEAYTQGHDIAFARGRYAPQSHAGLHLLAHELTHVVQQGRAGAASTAMPFRVGDAGGSEERAADAAADAVLAGRVVGSVAPASASLQRRSAPYIKKVTVHLTPPQSATLEWEGTPPAEATGSDSFTVSTGKGYSDENDPPRTCTRECCSSPETQCDAPWNEPGRSGACCTFTTNSAWAGVPEARPDGWKWWTPIQPHYRARSIALHSHPEVTGQPIGHGCVRMDEPNAKRIFDYSNGRRTNITIEGRASPVLCTADRRCAPPAGAPQHAPGGATGETPSPPEREPEGLAPVVPGLEGELS